MYKKTLRVATRKSKLALWQAHYVCKELLRYHPKLKIKIIPITTVGDITIKQTTKINNNKKGSFIKELEYAILENRADIAVHSMKDVTISFPKGLGIAAICKREDPRDALVNLYHQNVDTLPKGSIIGTSSLRRKHQIKQYRSDIIIKEINGNIDSRIKKLKQKQYDAIILAMAGLKRLSIDKNIATPMNTQYFLPAIGQGAIGIECKLNDYRSLTILHPLNHKETEICVNTERIINVILGINCQLPIGSYAKIKNNQIWLRTFIASPDGKKTIKIKGKAPLSKAKQLGLKIAHDLLSYKKKYNNK